MLLWRERPAIPAAEITDCALLDNDAALSPSRLPGEPATRRQMQELGRKGLETRRRLMAAAHDLLQSMSPVSLTATAIARHAKTSSATFYVYFDDVSDVVLALAQEASEDLDAVMAVLENWRAGRATLDGAAAFYTAYSAYWDRHRAILSIRNMEADRGDQRFLDVRSEAGLRVIRMLGALIHDGHAPGELSDEESIARAIVIFAAIERLAAAARRYPTHNVVPSAAAIAKAQIAILAELVTRDPKTS